MEEIEDSYLLFYEQDVDNYQDDEGHTKPEEKGKINNKKGKKLHSIFSKLKIIEYAKHTSRKDAIKKFNVPEQTLSDWFKNESKFLEIKNKNKTTIHKGGNLLNPEIEKKLISHIEFNRKLLNPITTISLVIKLMELWPERENFSLHTNLKYIYDILKRNNFSIRCKTHVGQPLPDNCFYITSKFLNKIWSDRKYWSIDSFLIGNLDETPIFFNMIENRTVSFKGLKTVTIKTQNQDKCRCSVLLAITADGNKLPRLILFMAKEAGKVEKKLLKNENVINGKCLVCCNNNAWCTSTIMKKWYNNIWLKYLNKFNLEEEDKSILILDKASSHYSEDFLNNIDLKNTLLHYIPGGLTRFLQPLDVCINAPFKKCLKNKYVLFCCNNEDDEKVTKEKMIEWIVEAWDDSKVITKELVYNSFRCTGIGNNLNREEDSKFTAWSKMKTENPIIIDDIEKEESNNIKQDNFLEDEDEFF